MKAIIQVGYKEYAIDARKAVEIMELLEGAERYQSKYWGGGKPTTYHVYEDADESVKNIQLLDEKLYRMAKLAGKPEEK